MAISTSSSWCSTLIAAWDFNDSSNRLGVSTGSGSMSLWPGAVALTNYAFYSGTTVNALPGVPDGQALVISPTNVTGFGNGTTWFQFKLDLTTYEGITMKYAQYRLTDFTFNSFSVAYSTDGLNFTEQTSYSSTATGGGWGSVRSVDFTSATALDGAKDVYIRFTFSGATGSNALAYRNGLDNVQFYAASVIPETSTITMLLGGSAVLMAFRRKRA